MQQAIIQILDAIAKESMESFWESIGTDVYPTWISTAKERIQTLWDGWIPVDDVWCELPQDEWDYLVYDWKNIRVAYFVKWKWFWYLWCKIYITHWMPLPLPPVTK